MIRVINEVRLFGNMATHPEWKEATTTSQSRIWFKFALSSEKPEGKTTYIDVVAWDKHANNIAQYCGKGHELYICGTLESNSNSTYIVVDKVTFGSPPSKQHSAPIPLSSRELPLQSEEFEEEEDYYEDPHLMNEPTPEPQNETKEEVSLEEKSEMARFLVDAGLGPGDIKELLIKLTMKEMEKREDNF